MGNTLGDVREGARYCAVKKIQLVDFSSQPVQFDHSKKVDKITDVKNKNKKLRMCNHSENFRISEFPNFRKLFWIVRGMNSKTRVLDRSKQKTIRKNRYKKKKIMLQIFTLELKGVSFFSVFWNHF